MLFSLTAKAQPEGAVPETPVPAMYAPIINFVEREDVNIEVNVGGIFGETEPDNPKGEVPFWLKASYVIPTESGWFSEVGLSHRSNVERNGDEVACDSWFSATGYEKKNFFGKIEAHKCFNSDQFSEGDLVYEYNLGYRFGGRDRAFVSWFHVEVEGDDVVVGDWTGSYRVEGVKLGYRL